MNNTNHSVAIFLIVNDNYRSTTHEMPIPFICGHFKMKGHSIIATPIQADGIVFTDNPKYKSPQLRKRTLRTIRRSDGCTISEVLLLVYNTHERIV